MEPTRIMLRLYFGPLLFGPGKAELLQAIAEEGSIAAAGRRMGMSYKRAWTLVEQMNAGFAEPLVQSARGGAQGGGAGLTPTGETVLAAYRALVAQLQEAGADQIAAIGALVRPAQDPAGASQDPAAPSRQS